MQNRSAHDPDEVPVVDAIVIGRNEGMRLVSCLASLRGSARFIIYVDSGSTDGSIVAAHEARAEVVALDMSRPFTAARARNAGLAAALAMPQPAEYLQFVDGDCAVDPGWIPAALAFLGHRPDAALAAGRRRERYPHASVYNLLCDREWDTTVGPAWACGGDALIRRAAIEGIDGYRDDVIAAEDDEMCQRLIAAGWRLWRIEAEMTLHDAAIQRFGQWWRRAVRAGHGFAQVGALHPGYFASARRRVWIWGAVLPLIAPVGLVFCPWLTMAVLGLYVLSFGRVAWRFRRSGLTFWQALHCAALITLSKFPNLRGILTWEARRRRGAAATIIEYK